MSLNSVIGYEVNEWFYVKHMDLQYFFLTQEYDENIDYEHQFMNLQAAQKSINKKADSFQPPAPLSATQIQNALKELKQGNAKMLT